MKRFITLFILGAVTIVGAQVTLNIQVHPDKIDAPIHLLPSVMALITGAAMVLAGLIGLAENYETQAKIIPYLLKTKNVDQIFKIPIDTIPDIRENNRIFWRSYLQVSLFLCIPMIGMLSIGIVAVGYPLFTYMASLSGLLSITGLICVAWGFNSISNLRSSYTKARNSKDKLEKQPDASELRTRKPKSPILSHPMWTSHNRRTRQIDVKDIDKKRSKVTVKTK